jgi:hypothetical protein
MEISLTSLGSSQTFRRPHFRTEAASRFWSLSDTMMPAETGAAGRQDAPRSCSPPPAVLQAPSAEDAEQLPPLPPRQHRHSSLHR